MTLDLSHKTTTKKDNRFIWDLDKLETLNGDVGKLVITKRNTTSSTGLKEE